MKLNGEGRVDRDGRLGQDGRLMTYRDGWGLVVLMVLRRLVPRSARN